MFYSIETDESIYLFKGLENLNIEDIYIAWKYENTKHITLPVLTQYYYPEDGGRVVEVKGTADTVDQYEHQMVKYKDDIKSYWDHILVDKTIEAVFIEYLTIMYGCEK